MAGTRHALDEDSMSKAIKHMEMSALKNSFGDTKNFVFLSVTGLNSIVDNQVRLALRKKGIRMQMIKNSLARKVFADLGMTIEKGWEGPTTVAWGGNSVAELSKELSGVIKKYEKHVKAKSAVAEGQEITFEQATKMPTKQEILSTIIGMIMSPASQIASQLGAPASQIASQIKQIVENKEKEGAEKEGAPAA